MVHIHSGIRAGVGFADVTEIEFVHGPSLAKRTVDYCCVNLGYLKAKFDISRNAFYKDCGIRFSEP
jgi:hypothetical protein